MNFKLKNCSVYVSYPFAAFVTLAIIADGSGIVFISLAAAVFHELGHLLCMRLCDCFPSNIKITLFDFSINDNMSNSRSSRKDLFIYASGCAVNFFAGTFFSLISRVYPLAYFPSTASAVNFLIGIFNILPVCGLDGGNILHTVLNNFLPEKSCIIILKSISFVILILLFTVGIITVFNNSYNFSYIITACYLLCTVLFKQ